MPEGDQEDEDEQREGGVLAREAEDVAEDERARRPSAAAKDSTTVRDEHQRRDQGPQQHARG